MKYKEHTIQRRRISFLFSLLGIFVAIIIAKLFIIQIMQHDYYKTIAKDQHWLQKEIPAKRGQILSKDDFPLAINITKYLVYAIPYQIKNPDETALKLAPILEMSKEELLEKISNKKSKYALLKRELSKEEVEIIEEQEFQGIAFQSEHLRSYPEGELAAHILGFVDKDGNGQYGVEGHLDNSLKGTPGRLKTERDTEGTQILFDQRSTQFPQDGNDYILTIDRVIQYKVEKVLKESVEKHQAKSGNAIVLDPKTGAVLAMTCYPTFDPNLYFEEKSPFEVYKNSCISSVFEPGSIFKPIAMAAGLDTEKINPQTTHNCTGSLTIGGYTISNSDHKAHGKENMIKVIERSCNVGIIFVVQQLGGEIFYDYINKFGFSEPTGIELDGERPGDIKPIEEWKEINFATAGFGQGIAVTPLQMITAISAIANEGKLMRPYIVNEVRSPDKEAQKTEPQVVEQVISSSAAKTLSAMMVSVVEYGHGYQSKVEGYRIAGKTGTAQVPVEGKYESGKTIGSFIGFGPVEDPRFIVMVKIDEPQGVTWAESTAAPAVGEIIKWLLDYYQIPPSG